MKQRNRLLTEDILRQKIKHRLDLQLKNLLRSGANLERLIKALREAGFSEEKSEKVARLYHSSEFSKPNPEKLGIEKSVPNAPASQTLLRSNLRSNL